MSCPCRDDGGGHIWAPGTPGEQNRCRLCGFLGDIFERKTSTDPAIRAAVQAMLTVTTPTVEATAKAAARIALDQIKELHKPVIKRFHGYSQRQIVCDQCYRSAAWGIEGLWPCETAKLCYTSKELELEL